MNPEAGNRHKRRTRLLGCGQSSSSSKMEWRFVRGWCRAFGVVTPSSRP